eukprot:4284421-Prymnesium_polylepis.1
MADSTANQPLMTAEHVTADLQEIRARTMYQMVEELEFKGGITRKLLFMTNRQTSLLTSLKGSMKRLLDAFELPPPKLIIVINHSKGTEYECDLI